MQSPIYYAPPIPWYRGRRIQIIIVRLLIISAIAFAAVWAFRLVQQLQFLHEQRKWMQYTMPADKIVLAEGTPEVQRLLKTPGYHELIQARLRPQAAVAYGPSGEIFSSKDICVVLHRFRATGSHERLVEVSVASQSPIMPGEGHTLWASTIIPANLRLGSRPVFGSSFIISGSLEFPDAPSLRIFAGQPDPADESHFTIRYELDGKSNIIDGWLMPDDTVKLEPRN